MIDFNSTRKKCSGCKQYKLFTEFPKDKWATGGLSTYCKLCKAIRNKEAKDRMKRSSEQRRKHNG